MAISTPTTPGQVLTSAYVNNNINSGMVLIKSQNVAATQSSISVTGVFSANYDNYKVMYTGGTASVSLNIQLQLTGITTGYYGAAILGSYGGGAASVDGFNNVSFFPAGKGNVGSQPYCFVDLEILCPFLNLPKLATGPYVSGDVALGYVTSRSTVTTSCTGFTLATSTGTVSNGTIHVYGYRKA